MTETTVCRPLPATILHVVTSLELGGAQRMLAKLVAAPLSEPTRTHVVSLVPAGELAAPIRASGATVHSLGLGQGRIAPLGLVALAKLLRQLRPDLVQGWMYHGNLAASLAVALTAPSRAKRAPLLWNIRGALDDFDAEPRLTRWVIKAGAHLSTRPDAIIYNAKVAARQHAARGYATARATIIGNGFDLEAFRPDPDAGRQLRERLGIPVDRPLVGIAAEVRPMKDHPTLFAALARLSVARLSAQRPAPALVMLGRGACPSNPELTSAIAAHGLADHVHLLGPLAEPAPVIKGFDIAVLSSAWGEGFPNFIGEAMAAGIPCVTTDTGDCRAIIGDTGSVVRPRDPAALADALGTLLALEPAARAALGKRARARIAARYTLPAVVEAYRQLYASCMSTIGRPGGTAGLARAA